MARARHKLIASVLLICCTFAFIVCWFLFGRSMESPKVTVALIAYSNSAEGLVAIVGVTNRGSVPVVSDGAPMWDLEVRTTSGFTNTHTGQLTITEWLRVLATGQGASLNFFCLLILYSGRWRYFLKPPACAIELSVAQTCRCLNTLLGKHFRHEELRWTM